MFRNREIYGCLLKHLFRRKWKKPAKLRVTGLCEGNSPFPTQKTSYAENISIWWRHHDPVAEWIHTMITSWHGNAFRLTGPLCEGSAHVTTGLSSQKVSNVELGYFPWWRHQMERFFALLTLCAGNSPVTIEFPSQWPVTQSFDVFFDLRLEEQSSK